MKAMIFAAGLGTRLKPFTDHVPKALVTVGGKTLLETAIQKLSGNGFSEIVVNVHHFADQVITGIKNRTPDGTVLHISDEREQLLETGGGLKKAAPLLAGPDPVLLYNVDVLSDIDLNALLEYHCASKALATLAVRKRKSDRVLLFGPDRILAGWKNEKTGELKVSRPELVAVSESWAFSGIQVISPLVLSMLGNDRVFSIIDTYLELARNNIIKGYTDDSSLWLDVGKPEQLAEAQRIFG